MLRSLLYFLQVFLVVTVKSDNEALYDNPELPAVVSTTTPRTNAKDKGWKILSAIFEIENTVALRDKEHFEGLAIEDKTKYLIKTMVVVLDNIIHLVEDIEYANKFLEAQGFQRCIVPNLGIQDEDLRMQLLTLIRTLFIVTPNATKNVIPIELMDKILDIFEHDNKIVVKALVLDVLSEWLPGNPKAQARVIIVKGLEPFYEQVNKLDTVTTVQLLKLFNSILEEHVKVRNATIQKSKGELNNLRQYQKIGLLERLNSPKFCAALLNIFESSWTEVTDNSNIMQPVFDLMKNVKPSCSKWFKGNDRAIQLFSALSKYIMEPNNRKYYEEELQVNMTDVQQIIEDYVFDIKLDRTEL